MKRILCLMISILLLCGGVFAAGEEAGLQAQIEAFLQENGLTDTNFSMSYYNLSTGEAYAFNDTAYQPVGMVWTLPLHMYYYKQETLGMFDAPPERPEEVYTIAGLTLEDCRYHSILRQDNDISEKMREQLGTTEQYQKLINEEFGHMDADALPEEYLTKLRYSAAFLMNCLKELTAHEEYYGELTKNYSLVQSAGGFAGYGKSYPLVHILGEEDGTLCDVGVVSAPQAYLLVCTISAEDGQTLLGKLNALVCSYVEDQASNPTPTEATRDTERSDASFTLTTPQRNDRAIVLRWIFIALSIAFCLTGAVLLVLWLLRRRKENRRYKD